jgi:DNA-binding SARP family transcriptional activator/ATP/maltotriose-dependent transcriptional regulator MalT
METASGAGATELEVRLLGPIEAERTGAHVALGGLKPRTLLAVLALEAGRVVSVDRLVEALWPGDPPDTAAHAVQVYVSQLRKSLGPVIATRAPGYVLELDSERVDAHRFTRLAQEGGNALAGDDPAAAEGALRDALALWRGPALADFLYEPFAQTEIARLEDLRTVVLEERIDADLALGRHAELVSELEALVQAQPLRERPRGQLMLALYRSGRQADALAAYRAARETLVEELGIEPGPELRELEAAILRQDDSLLLEETPSARPAMQFRRLVTILFVDVVESMALAATIDAEALGRVLRSYFETVSTAIRRHGGTVEKYAGDAVMAAFGIPVSHEDDALRAARAALDVRAGIAALNAQLAGQHGVGLEIRIGIEAGEVVATPTDARQRLVTGEAVGIAAKLEASAGSDEIVVGELAARLIDHAAHLEALGDLDIKGLGRHVAAYRLLELEPASPAFEQRLDARLVGRKRELAALRRTLKRAIDASAARVALVTAPPGVGKSRLVAEFARRAKGVTTLWGRCLSYGDGITYWPLREALAAAEESEEHAAILAALDAETPMPSPEIAFLFRRFCEAQARAQPLIVVFDDVHWAEPTFLELVEHVAAKGDGPILVVCLARDELAELRPEFLEAPANVDRIELDLLSGEEVEALVDGLGGGILDTDQRVRVVETAEGNPLFLEQLLALALEGGLTGQQVPETIQALLAARLDRLGPGERAVLERGAVIGKEFRLDDVAALLEPEAAPTADVHMSSLAARGFVRPVGAGEYRFRHVLVQDAVYRAAPKRLRAQLHERFIDRFESRTEEAADTDEFAGYHLEQAYRLRTELGESDRHARQLADDAGRRLRSAGMRALKRGDAPAAAGLLERSSNMLAQDDAARWEVVCDFALALYSQHQTHAAVDLLESVLAEPASPATANTQARAGIELEFVRLRNEVGRTADQLLGAIDAAIPIFERLRDDRALGRALLLSGWVQGGRRGNNAAWTAAAERALGHYESAGWPLSVCLGQIAISLYWGSSPVLDAVRRIETLRDQVAADLQGAANLNTFLGGLVAQLGDFNRARELIGGARSVYDSLGLHAQVRTYPITVLGEIELLAGDAAAAVAVLRQLCEDLERYGDFSHLSSRASDLAEGLLMLDRVAEAEEWIAIARKYAADDDVQAQLMWRPVAARIGVRNGAFEPAERLARAAVAIADTTDDLNRGAKAYAALASVLGAAGRQNESTSARTQAIELYEAKGNVVGAKRIRAHLGDVALV